MKSFLILEHTGQSNRRPTLFKRALREVDVLPVDVIAKMYK
ncbi:MAG TPA: hypothetical protein VIM70_12485 [Clostridium sp.]